MINIQAVNKTAPTNWHTNDRTIRHIGSAIVLITFGIFGAWSFFSLIDSSALAPGIVVVKSYSKTVQHLEGGIVAKILVKDGDLVQEGQLLLTLDDVQIKAELEIIRAQNIALAAKVARLRAERDKLKTVDYPKLLQDDSDLRIVEAKMAESNAFSSRKSANDGEVEILNQRIAQTLSKIQGLQGQVKSKKQLIDSYADEIRDLKELLAEGFTDKQHLREVERNHALQSGEAQQLSSEIVTSQMSISEARLQILQVQKKFQKEVSSMLIEAQSQLNDSSERLSVCEDKLNRIDIKAPASGMAFGLTVHNENSVIAPGSPILYIVPQNSELIIEARISPLDIDRVTVGLKTEIRFSAFSQSKTPKMSGLVIELSADRLTDEKTGNAYYKARIELASESSEQLGKLKLLPGMPAEVFINTGERTLFEYLAEPVTNSFARALTEE